MNGVLTQKELKILRKAKDKERVEEVASVDSSLPVAPEPAPVEAVSEENHFLFHPDNPSHSSGYITQEYTITVMGKRKVLSVTNGVLCTDSLSIKSELEKQGFVYMYSKPKE